MGTECTAAALHFHAVARRTVQARFDGLTLTSDGGAVLLREVDRVTGISAPAPRARHTPARGVPHRPGHPRAGARYAYPPTPRSPPDGSWFPPPTPLGGCAGVRPPPHLALSRGPDDDRRTRSNRPATRCPPISRRRRYQPPSPRARACHILPTPRLNFLSRRFSCAIADQGSVSYQSATSAALAHEVGRSSPGHRSASLGWAHHFLSEHLAEHRLVERQIGDHALQASIFLVTLPELAQFTHIQARVLLLPAVQRRLLDSLTPKEFACKCQAPSSSAAA
jgi:hypothetical protein